MAAVSDYDSVTESEPPPYTPVAAPVTARRRQSSSLSASASASSSSTSQSKSISLTLIYQLLQLTSLLPALTGVLYLIIRFSSRQLPLPNPSRIEYLASTPWAVLTAVHSFQIISSMLHRWKRYYHPISIIIRLLSIQAASFPWIRVTLWLCSTPEKPLLAWIIVAVTTAISSSIARWYISNLGGVTSRHKPKARHLDIARLLTRTILPIFVISLLSLLIVLYDLYSVRLSVSM